jgi:hypothetical protein
MKIAILGKGTSAILTALECIRRNHDVEIYYDPNKPHLSVGESTTPHVAAIIKDVFDVSIGDLIDKNIVSLKNGIKFNGWGIGNKFHHYFNSNNVAFHFESSIFNEFFHEALKDNGVKYHAFKVEKYDIDLNNEKVVINDIAYDHLICCSGWSETDEYKEPIFETVNSALTYSREYVGSQPYTEHLATVDGWQFGLPFPDRNIIKHGYLFNNKFTGMEDAKKNLNVEDCNHISWKPKYCKKMIQNRFCSYNGNRLMFLEPLQALSLYYYLRFARRICNFIENKSHENYVRGNLEYHDDMYNYQLSLAWHYSYGSKHQTEFWEDVTKRANNLLTSSHKMQPEYLEESFYFDKKYREPKYFSIGCFEYLDYVQIDSGMNGEEVKIKDTYTDFF